MPSHSPGMELAEVAVLRGRLEVGTEGRGDDLGGLDRPGQQAGAHDVDLDRRLGEAVAQRLGLAATEVGEAGAALHPGDHPAVRRLRSPVADEQQAGVGHLEIGAGALARVAGGCWPGMGWPPGSWRRMSSSWARAAICWANRVAWMPWKRPSSQPTSWAWAMRSSASDGLLAVAEGDRHPVELLAEVGRQGAAELAHGRLVDLPQAGPGRLVERRAAHLLEELLDHGADPHDLGRLLDGLPPLLAPRAWSGIVTSSPWATSCGSGAVGSLMGSKLTPRAAGRTSRPR